MLCFAAPFCIASNLQAAVAHVSQWKSEETNFEGLRVAVDEGDGRAGWLMNRMSLHEPIVIFNVESVSFRSSESDGDSRRIVRENCSAWLEGRWYVYASDLLV